MAFSVRPTATDMGIDAKGSVVVCTSSGINGTWGVAKKGCQAPLASFDDKEDAYAYMTDLSKSKPNTVALAEDEEGFSPLPDEIDSDQFVDVQETAPRVLDHACTMAKTQSSIGAFGSSSSTKGARSVMNHLTRV